MKLTDARVGMVVNHLVYGRLTISQIDMNSEAENKIECIWWDGARYLTARFVPNEIEPADLTKV